jgi:hypothetical protein
VEKVVYVVRGGSPHGELANTVGPALAAAGALHVVVHEVDPAGDARYRGPGPWVEALGPFVGTVAFWIDCIDDLAPYDATVRDGRTAHGYLVTESVPIRSTDTPVPGRPTPGFTLLTVLDKPDRLDEATFLHHWTTEHTPRTLRYAPLTGYVRNHVVRALTPGAPRLAGIVSEQVAVLEDMTDPVRFMGAADDPELARTRGAEMAVDVAAFLDLDRVEAHCALEQRF